MRGDGLTLRAGVSINVDSETARTVERLAADLASVPALVIGRTASRRDRRGRRSCFGVSRGASRRITGMRDESLRRSVLTSISRWQNTCIGRTTQPTAWVRRKCHELLCLKDQRPKLGRDRPITHQGTSRECSGARYALDSVRATFLAQASEWLKDSSIRDEEIHRDPQQLIYTNAVMLVSKRRHWRSKHPCRFQSRSPPICPPEPSRGNREWVSAGCLQ